MFKASTYLMAIFSLVLLIGFTAPVEAQQKSKSKAQKAKVNTPWEKRADKNKDGTVGKKERAVAKEKREARKEKRSEHKEKREARREKLDKDGDGKVSQEERKAARRQAAKQYDKDGDGKLSKEEKAAMVDARKISVNEGREGVRQKFDKNSDGYLSGKEKKAFREAKRENHKKMKDRRDKRKSAKGDAAP